MIYNYKVDVQIEVGTVDKTNDECAYTYKGTALYIPENRIFARSYSNISIEQIQQWLQEAADTYLDNKVPNCKRCGKAISLMDDGWCEPCRDELEEEHYDNMAQDAYEYPDEQTIINSYRR